MRPVVLDAGGLIAFERGDVRVRRLIELALERCGLLHVPAVVVGQVWRDGARQVRLARLLASPLLQVHALSDEEARAAGALCGQAATADVIDASVVLLARRRRAPVLTSDPHDLRRLDPRVELLEI